MSSDTQSRRTAYVEMSENRAVRWSLFIYRRCSTKIGALQTSRHHHFHTSQDSDSTESSKCPPKGQPWNASHWRSWSSVLVWLWKGFDSIDWAFAVYLSSRCVLVAFNTVHIIINLNLQAILASATLSEDVSALKQIFLHNPVVLKLEEPELAPTAQLSHYHINAEETDKAAILYALFKLHLIRGKSIIFVNTVDRCYK